MLDALAVRQLVAQAALEPAAHPRKLRGIEALRVLSFAILIETGSKVCRNVVQHSGRPHEP